MEAGTETRTWDGLEELRPVLERFLARRCRDAAEVEDVVQETVLRAARYRGGLTDAAKLRPWALRIARNVLADRMGGRRRERLAQTSDEVLEGLPAPPQAEEDDEEDEYRVGGWVVEREVCLRILSRSLAVLREEDRSVLHAYYERGRSCRATAGECGLPEGLVKVRLYRARRRLLQAMRRFIALEGGRWAGGAA